MPHRLRPLVALIALLAISLSPGSGSRSSAQAEQRIFLPAVMRSATSSDAPLRTGNATYYVEADGSGNCMFDPTPDDLMVAAMNHTDYANAALCGAYVAINGPKGSVTVRIVDRCPECAPGSIDLSPQAFDRIADRAAGIVPITWRIVSPELSRPIAYRFKEGSNQWWTAVQVRHHRNPIARLEYRDPAGQFVAVPRTEYNYFVAEAGMGAGPFTFRVTDIYGNVLIDTGIPHNVGVEISGSGQFPPAP
jgi:expansin